MASGRDVTATCPQPRVETEASDTRDSRKSMAPAPQPHNDLVGDRRKKRRTAEKNGMSRLESI